MRRGARGRHKILGSLYDEEGLAKFCIFLMVEGKLNISVLYQPHIFLPPVNNDRH